MELVDEVYRATEKFPSEERYSLTDQIRRAVVSIPSNIAEGAGRNTKKEFIYFLHMSQASLSELDTQLEIAARLRYLIPEEMKKLDELMVRIDKMLTGLIRSQKVLSHNTRSSRFL
jgi:four helix bundle protein